MSSPRSTKWRPLSGISCTVRWSMTWPTEVVTCSITGASPTTLTSSAMLPRLSRTFCTADLRDLQPQVGDARGPGSRPPCTSTR